MSVPYTFATATSSIPLSQLDSNFATAITLGGTNLYLGNTTTTVTGLTLTGSTFTGNVTTSNATITGGTIDGTVIGGTTAAAGTFTTVTAATHVATASTTGSANKGAYNYGTLGFSDTGIVQSAQTSVNSYFQNVIQNTSNGTQASAEFIAYNDQGTATTNYATVGINSSGYSGTGSINAPGYGFFVTASTDLVLGTIGSNAIHFTTNSSATDALAISSAGAVSLPGGTANGVAYLNGSKVLTTGSALTFDGTNFNVLSTGYLRLDNYGSTSGKGRFNIGNSGYAYVEGYDVGNAGSAAYLAFGLSTEQMRLTSTGLGIGTSSPAARLQVQDATANNGTMQLGGTTYYGTIKHNATGTGANEYNVASASGGGHQFLRGGTLQFMTDASGNLGLGVTPSAWSTLTGFDINTWGAVSAYTNQINVSSNAYYNGGWKYKQTNYATRYEQNSTGIHAWFTAPSGTAGTSISSFSQVMTLDNSGNLLVGTTTASSSNSNSLVFQPSAGFGAFQHASGTSSGTGYQGYYYNGSAIGSIVQSGTTAVTFNTTSDQRLKNDLGTVTSTDVIANTVIHDFTWKTDGSQSRGVFAQEAAKVLPAAVKVGDDGEEVTDQWQVDYSKYVPDIIVELQSLRARVAQLETQKG